MTSKTFKHNSIALVAGLMFGAGLAISGMNDTTKVQGFLDLAGDWDITLAFVMMGALAVGLIAFRIVLKRPSPIMNDKFDLPRKTHIDKRLISGALLFGIGWGLIGYCPGPALASISHGYWQTLVFILAMLVGAKISKKLLP